MPRDPFLPGTGPQDPDVGLHITVQAPATTSEALPIEQGQPLRWAGINESTGAASTVGLGRQCVVCTEGQVPELICEARVQNPYESVHVLVLKPAMAVGDPATGSVVTKLPIDTSPAPPTGTALAVVAGVDGKKCKIVAAAAGVGRVISHGGGYAEVLF